MPQDANPFGTRALIGIIGAGVVLLIGFLLMSGFGNALMPANPIHPSVESRAAIGFRALHDLAEAVRGATIRIDASGDYDHPGLLVLTPRIDTPPEHIGEILTRRAQDDLPTLIVLPKWAAAPIATRPGWAEGHGLLPSQPLSKLLPGSSLFTIRRLDNMAGQRSSPVLDAAFRLPDSLQAVALDERFDPVVSHPEAGALLFRLSFAGDVHVLADPDLINNIGMKSPENARAALEMLAYVSPDLPPDIAFDVTLPRAAAGRNLVQLMFTPPFLAVTIGIFAAALLAGLASANRFGPVRREKPPHALGKRALIDNIAALTRAAGRVPQGGARYLGAARQRMRDTLHAPADLDGDALTHWLDTRAPGYAEIDHRLRTARTDGELLDAARDLDDLQRKVTA